MNSDARDNMHQIEESNKQDEKLNQVIYIIKI